MPKENSKKTVKPGIIGKTNEIAIKNFNLVKRPLSVQRNQEKLLQNQVKPEEIRTI